MEALGLTIKPLIDVHCAVKKILPCVDNCNCDEELNSRHDVVINRLRDHKLPASKCWYFSATSRDVNSGRQPRISSSGKRTSKQWVCFGNVLRNCRGIETDKAKHMRQHSLCNANARRPDGNIIILLSCHLLRLSQAQYSSNNSLNHLLNDDVPRNFGPRYMVAL